MFLADTCKTIELALALEKQLVYENSIHCVYVPIPSPVKTCLHMHAQAAKGALQGTILEHTQPLVLFRLQHYGYTVDCERAVPSSHPFLRSVF